MSTRLTHMKLTMLDDFWNSDSDKFDELVTEIKANIAENGSVTIENDYFDATYVFQSHIEFADWLKVRFYKQ